MKKLLIAAALTASVCSFGANINANGFEAENSLADGYFNKGTSDASEVKSYEEGAAPAAAKATAAGAESIGSKYLSLSTEGDTLWRTINEYTTEEGVDVTSEKTVAATGTYIDTLVQFTATEEAPTTFEAGAKLAMWLQGAQDEDKTLYVRGASITAGAEGAVLLATPANIALDADVEAGTWYRLTVKAVTVADGTTGTPVMAFAIYIDGVLVSPVSSFVASDWVESIKAMETEDMKFFAISDTEFLKASLVPSLTAGTPADASLYGVGFKGTGAIDSIAWTDDDLFQEVSAGFTLTIAMNNVTAAEYTIGDDTAAVVGGKITGIEDKATVVIKATAVTEGYLAPAPVTVEVTKNDTIDLTAVAFADVTTTGDAAITEDNKNAILAWAKTGGNNVAQVEAAAAAGYLSDSYKLKVDNLSAKPEIEIVSIVPGDGTTAATVTAKVTVNGETEIQDLSTATFNGGATLMYKAATTLSGLDAATAAGTIPTTTEGSQFIKVVVE